MRDNTTSACPVVSHVCLFSAKMKMLSHLSFVYYYSFINGLMTKACVLTLHVKGKPGQNNKKPEKPKQKYTEQTAMCAYLVCSDKM